MKDYKKDQHGKSVKAGPTKQTPVRKPSKMTKSSGASQWKMGDYC